MGGALISKARTYESDSESDSSDDDNKENIESSDNMITDAVGHNLEMENNCSNRLDFNHISVGDVTTLENELDLYEKISLIYLLYDDPNTAMKDMQLLIDGFPLLPLSKWAKSFDNPKWKKQFIEALGVIQNYKILKQLGFQKIDIKTEFLPKQACFTASLNKLKKCMYCIFDNFEPQESERILYLAGQDLSIPQQKHEYFEYIYMYFESVKYITKRNVNNILKHLKVMEKDVEYNNLKSIMHLFDKIDDESKYRDGVSDNVQHNEHQFTNHQNRYNMDRTDQLNYTGEEISSTSNDINYRTPKVSIHDPDKCYHINPDSPGICLIINNENFYTEFDPELKKLVPEETNSSKIGDRRGTELDKRKLESTFKKFGFTVICHNNKTHQEIEDIVKHTAHNVVKPIDSCLFICILSHGVEGMIIGSNSIPVEVNYLKTLVCSKQLSGKPKILILQACQGNACQKVGEIGCASDGLTTDCPTTNFPCVAKTSDIYELWATVPGFAAIRNINDGSWLIQTLCKMMIDYSDLHFVDICNMVKHEINGKFWMYKNEEGKIEKRAMVAQDTSTLHKFLYLPPLKI